MRPALVLFAAAVLAAATVLVKSKSNRQGRKAPEREVVLPVAIVQHSIPKHLASEAPLEELDGPPDRCPGDLAVAGVETVACKEDEGQERGSKKLEKDDRAEGCESPVVVGPAPMAGGNGSAPCKEGRRDKGKDPNGVGPAGCEFPLNRAVVEREEVEEEEEEDPWADYEIECARPLGGVEENWVRAVTSGTGVSVIMVVIARQVAAWQVTHAGRELQCRHAMLRSWIVFDRDGRPRFEISKHPFLRAGVDNVRLNSSGGVEITPTAGGRMMGSPAEGVDCAVSDWHQILEWELNTPIGKVTAPPTTGVDTSEDRFPALGLKLHFLPGGRCSVALRVHTAACDYAAVALAAGEFVNLLDQVVAQTDEQTFSGGSSSAPPVGMKRVFSNAGLHQEDEWLIGEQCEGSPGGFKMRRAVSSHKLHRNESAEHLAVGGMRKVQSALHLERGGFGSFFNPESRSSIASSEGVTKHHNGTSGGSETSSRSGGGHVILEPLALSKPRSESPSSCLQGPVSSSTSASSLSPDPDSHVAAANLFSRVPTEDGQALYDMSELPPLRPLRKRTPQEETSAPESPPFSPSFSSPMSFVSAQSFPLSPGSSPSLSPSPSFEFATGGGQELGSLAPPPSPLSSCQSPSRHVAMGLIDPFAELGGRSAPPETNTNSHPPKSDKCTIDTHPPAACKKPARIRIGPLEYLKGGSSALPCVEDLLDKNRAKKPFWAKGADLVGYSVGSLGKPMLAFQPGWAPPLRTQVVHSIIPQAATQSLLAACAAHNTSLYGALSASCFKAVAASKKTGPCPETYGITTMVNCRAELRAPMRETDVGFFHSALMHHHSVAEPTELWELAGRCSATLEKALQEDKQFKDMGVLNMLFYQAMQHPNLTPQSSMRTSVLCAFASSVHVPLPTTSKLELTEIIGCASVHGVGPCIGIFSFMINGNLHYCLAFPAPLFSREQVAWVNERMREMLTSCADNMNAD